MDSQEISSLLHSDLVTQHYTAQTGDYVRIDLPRIPLTRHTQFLQLDKEMKGDLNSFVEEPAPDGGEGSLLPRQVVGRAVRPGKVHIVLRAVDRLSGLEIPDVQPLDILVEVQ